jgi:chromosome segregation ATPase
MSTEQSGSGAESGKHVQWTDQRLFIPNQSSLSLDGLQKRLTESESSTKRLAERLAELGFSSEVRTNAELSQHHEHVQEPVKPFRAAIDTVQSIQAKLTEIANRLGVNEASLGTLHKTVEQIQLQQEAVLQHNDRYVKKMLSNESRTLSSDLAKSQRELKEIKKSQQDSRDVVLKLTSALDIATNNKMAILARIEEMKGAKQKTMSRMSEVKCNQS